MKVDAFDHTLAGTRRTYSRSNERNGLGRAFCNRDTHSHSAQRKHTSAASQDTQTWALREGSSYARVTDPLVPAVITFKWRERYSRGMCAFYQNKHVLSARYGLRSLQTKQKDSANREFI